MSALTGIEKPDDLCILMFDASKDLIDHIGDFTYSGDIIRLFRRHS